MTTNPNPAVAADPIRDALTPPQEKLLRFARSIGGAPIDLSPMQAVDALLALVDDLRAATPAPAALDRDALSEQLAERLADDRMEIRKALDAYNAAARAAGHPRACRASWSFDFNDCSCDDFGARADAAEDALVALLAAVRAHVDAGDHDVPARIDPEWLQQAMRDAHGRRISTTESYAEAIARRYNGRVDALRAELADPSCGALIGLEWSATGGPYERCRLKVGHTGPHDPVASDRAAGA